VQIGERNPLYQVGYDLELRHSGTWSTIL